MIDIKAQNLPQQNPQVLSIAERISGAPPISDPDVEVTIGAEGKLPGIVRRKWLGDSQQQAFAIGIGAIWVTRHIEAGKHHIPLAIVVVDKELPIGPLLGVKGQSEEALFVRIGLDATGNI